MLKEDLKKQSFKNEADEGEFWQQNQEQLADEFEQAAAAGTLGRGTAAREAGITPTTTIRLNPKDVLKARQQAEQRGLRYQTYLKMLIHEALERAEQAK